LYFSGADIYWPDEGVCAMTKSELIQLTAFEGNQIRKILHEGEWWFSDIDIVEIQGE
jgi:prophage antirepressor-like protein